MYLNNDQKFMELAFEQAVKGIGTVSPNPLVGAVLVKDGRVIGLGHHVRSGEGHAEVNAIKAATESVENSTLYCTLEPCCHTNKKTAPCTDLLIKEKISRVVVSNLDPNPYVSGKGVEKLRAYGIEVEVGLMQDKGEELNEVYFKWIKTGLPFVHLKYAQTLDGRIADSNGNSKWISNESARKQVHFLRLKYDAVLIGSVTNNVDLPKLNIRMGIDNKGKIPYRIVLGKPQNISPNSPILSDENLSKTFMICSESDWINCSEDFKKYCLDNGIKIIAIKDNDYRPKLNLEIVLRELGQLNITSLLVEGGSKVLTTFVDQNQYDKLTCFISPVLLGSGVSSYNSSHDRAISDSICLRKNKIQLIDDQVMVEGYR